ncbi:MAG: hypothetical protein AB2551_09200 [Candidatus Thiodiazotropha sp.]
MDWRKHNNLNSVSLIVCFIVATLLGCGGGSGDSSDDRDLDNDSPTEETNPDDTTQSQQINGPLHGRLFASRWGKYVDLETGEYTQIADGEGDVAIYPSADGREYLSRIDNHHHVEDEACYGFLIGVDAIEIRDVHTNLLKERFEVFENLWGIAKLSPDGQAIAVNWENDKGCPEETVERLTIFSRKGEILSQSSEPIDTFEWLPDNRLVYAKQKSIYVSHSQHSVEGVAIRDLSAMDGYPYRLTPSRDGSKILFEMVTKVPSWLESITYRDATVWELNINDSDLKLFATSRREDDPNSDYDNPRVNNPVFTLDGSEVLLTEDYFSGIAFVREWYSDDLYEVISLENSGLMFAVSSESDGIALPPDGSFSARIMRSKNSEGELEPLDEMIISNLALVPKVAAPVENPGSLPGRSSSINRGISGRLFYADSDYDQDVTVLRSLDLSSGNTSVIMQLTDDKYDDDEVDLGVSIDGDHWAYFFEQRGEKNLYIVDAAGNPLTTIPFDDERMDFYNEGAPQFSPVDNNVLVFQFEFDRGSLNDTKHVSVIDWQQGDVLKVFTDAEYISPRWTPAGDLLLWDRDGGVYMARVNGGSLGDPELLFQLPEAVIDPAISHDGTRMVFSMARHLWLCNLDGTGLTQLTAPGVDGFEQSPAWSPDDRYIVFKSSSDGERDGNLWVVASDADNVRIHELSNTAMPVKDDEQKSLAHIYGALTWR